VVASEPVTLREKLAAGRLVVSVEVDPPRGLNPERALAAAALLKEAGVDCINVGDSPLARVRMSPLFMGVLMQQRVGVETIVHFTTRDRNRMALHSDLVGAHLLGIRNVLCLRGDPPSVGGYSDVIGVWDVSAVGLIRLLKLLNDGVDWTGKPIGQQASFLIGASANPTAASPAAEVKQMRRKLEAGAHFLMTQAVYDPAALEGFLDQVQGLGVPVLVGVLPLNSFGHAEYLHREVPGMVVPEAVRERMRRAGERGLDEGLAIAREVAAVARARGAGVYLVPPAGRYEAAADLVAAMRRG
ncbi:MAG: methylenetetrahydrofolate reductase, partial [Dehalococcoidia bacterium]